MTRIWVVLLCIYELVGAVCRVPTPSRDLFETMADGGSLRYRMPASIHACLNILDHHKTKLAADPRYESVSIGDRTLISGYRGITFYAKDDKVNFDLLVPGTDRDTPDSGVVYWTVASDQGVTSGCQSEIPNGSWLFDSIPLAEGDNWITTVYTKDWSDYAYDHILVTKYRGVELGPLLFEPSESAWGAPVTVVATAKVEGLSNPRVTLTRIGKSRVTTVGAMRDDGKSSDSIAGDKTFTLRFTFTPSADSVYRFRLEVAHSAGRAHSGIEQYSGYPPFDPVLMQAVSTVPQEAMKRYAANLATMNSDRALEEVLSWLQANPYVISAGRNASPELAIFLVFKYGISVLVTLGKRE